MNRTRLLAGALAAVASLAVGMPSAHAEAGPAALGTHLRYQYTGWTGTAADSSAMPVIEAPKAWQLTVTPGGQGRFNDDSRTWLLTADWPAKHPRVRTALARAATALKGTRDLRIVTDTVRSRGNGKVGVLTYTFTTGAGEARWVSYRFVGYDATLDHVASVAGRPQDARGLDKVLTHAVTTMGIGGGCGGGM